MLVDDPPRTAGLTTDPDDDYLVSLTSAAGVDALVSGDRHLLTLRSNRPPVLTPRQFLDQFGNKTAPDPVN